MKRFIHVAAIQMHIVALDKKANLTKAEKLLEQALQQQKLDLVVFPEDFITGPIPYNLEYALSTESDEITFFKNLARKHKVFIVCGSFIRKSADKYFNASVLIDNTGEIILQYDKNNLWHPERRYVTAGATCPVVKTSIGTIGLAICWDLAFPDTFKQLAANGADIICCPSYWTSEDGGAMSRKYPNIDAEVNMVDALCPARAIENEALVIYANGAKQSDIYLKTTKITVNQIGHSQICTPIFGTVAKINNNDEGFICYSYDRNIGKDAESNYKIRKDWANAKV